MLGSQRGHGVQWQVCLAHLLRDAAYAIECGDTAFSALFRWLLLRAPLLRRGAEIAHRIRKRHLPALHEPVDAIPMHAATVTMVVCRVDGKAGRGLGVKRTAADMDMAVAPKWHCLADEPGQLLSWKSASRRAAMRAAVQLISLVISTEPISRSTMRKP